MVIFPSAMLVYQRVTVQNDLDEDVPLKLGSMIMMKTDTIIGGYPKDGIEMVTGE